MDRKQIHRMTKPQLVEFALEYSTWIGPRDIPLSRWSQDELVTLCLDTIARPPLSEERRAEIKACR